MTQGGQSLREVTVTGPGWSYSAAEQAQDGAAANTRVEVAQMSDQFGPGPFRTIALGA